MQTELTAKRTGSDIAILGVNEQNLEADNAEMCEGRDIPWLQDTTAVDVWHSWDVTYRDVVILNGENEPVAVYNLTEHDLRDSANYDALKALLLATAAR